MTDLQGDTYTRDIIPNLDLLDANKQDIPSGSWQQPSTGNYATAEVDQIIYNGIRNSDHKTITFLGVRNLQSNLYAETITFSTSSAVRGIEGVQQLLSSSSDDTGGMKMFPNAYHYGINDSLKISIRPKQSGVQDQLLFIGVVTLPAGVFD